MGADHVVPAKIARIERHDPLRAIRLLEPLVLDRRRERLLGIIEQRLESVQVLFDAPHDPHNGAAVVRSCEVFGIQFVHVVERREPFLISPTVTRGAEKWIDLRRWPSVDAAVAKLRADGLELIGAHPDGDLAPEDLAKIPRIALVLGNERDGIGVDLAKACSRRVRVPMRGFSESLNVSVSAAILLAAATAGRPGDLPVADRNRMYARGLYFTVGRADDVLEEE
jgi:tRNA (guanosine-2'-O-)-methyltransferase